MASPSSLSPPVLKRYCSETNSCQIVKRIAVEGNIGKWFDYFDFDMVILLYEILLVVLCIAAGKSTFLSLIEKHSSSYSVIGEPLTRWTNVPMDDEVTNDPTFLISQLY